MERHLTLISLFVMQLLRRNPKCPHWLYPSPFGSYFIFPDCWVWLPSKASSYVCDVSSKRFFSNNICVDYICVWIYIYTHICMCVCKTLIFRSWCKYLTYTGDAKCSPACTATNAVGTYCIIQVWLQYLSLASLNVPQSRSSEMNDTINSKVKGRP